MMAAAFAGPMPGRVSRSAALAVLICIGTACATAGMRMATTNNPRARIPLCITLQRLPQRIFRDLKWLLFFCLRRLWLLVARKDGSECPFKRLLMLCLFNPFLDVRFRCHGAQY